MSASARAFGMPSPLLLLRVASLQARKQMSYRVDFWVGAVVTFSVELAVAFFLWRAIFAGSGQTVIAGFTFEAMLAYYVLVLLAAKLTYGRQRDMTMSEEIYDGSLNRYLLFPVPYGAMKYAESLGNLVPALVQVALFGAVSLWILPLPDELGLTPGSVVRAAVSILVANALLFLMRFPIQAIAFWAENIWSLLVMLRFVIEFFGGVFLPLDLFPAPLVAALRLTPLPYLFYEPVMVLTGRTATLDWLVGLGVCAVWLVLLALLSAWVWRRGNLTYAGVGI